MKRRMGPGPGACQLSLQPEELKPEEGGVLLLSNTLDRISQNRRVGKVDRNPIPLGYYHVLALRLARHPIAEISELTGYATGTIYSILQDPRVTAIRQQLMKDLDDELENLKPLVIQAVKNHLESPSLDAQYKGADMWFKVHGKYKVQPSVSLNLSAEDVAVQIIQQVKEKEDGSPG